MLTGFVGRGTEFGRLESCLSLPRSVVLVEGEAGVGKSRLMQEFLASDAVCTKSALVALCPPFRRPFTLGPIVEGLRSWSDGVDDLRLDALAGALRPLFPEWAADLPPAPEPLQDSQAERSRLFAALAQLLDRLDVSLLVLEDVHWADEATLEFLLQLTTRQPEGMGVLVTYRPTEVAPDSLLPRLASRVPPGSARERLTLAPFDLAQTTALVSSMLDGDPISDEFATYLYERTEGLPLAVEESVRLLGDRSELVRRKGAWLRRGDADLEVAPMVRDSVLQRVQPLSEHAHHILRAASVLAEPSDAAVLAAVSGLPAEQAHDGAVEAIGSGLVGEDTRGRVSFRHVLAAKAVYESITGPERRPLHLRAGHALADTSPQPLPRLVYHFRKAGDAGNWALYGELAADVAIAAGDDSTGVLLLNDLVSARDLPVKTRSRLAKKLAGAEVFRRSVDSNLVRKVVTTLQGILGAEGLAAREQAEIRSPLGRLLMQLAEFEAGRAELERAIPDLDHDPAEATRAMVYLGWPYGSAWPASKHIEWLRRAADRQPATMSPIDQLTLTVDRMTTLLLLGEESGWELADAIPARASSVQEGLQATRGHGNAGHTAMLWGRYADARDHLETALQLADSGRFERIHAPILASQGHLLWLTGEWEGLAPRVEKLGSQCGERLPQLEATLVSGLLQAAGGDVHQAEGQLTQLMEEVSSQYVPDIYVATAAAVAGIQLAQGRVGEALAVTEAPVRVVTSKGAWVWASEIAPARVSALIGAGQVEEARWLTTAFARGLRGLDAPGPGAALMLCRALLAQARAEHPLVVAQQLGEVAAAWDALPRPYLACLARRQQADSLLKGGEPETGLTLLEDVRESLVRLGALVQADEVVVTLREHGVTAARPRRGGRRAYGDELSPREVEVVRLLVSGRTNREIGEILVLSPKTVARHLDSARRKLKVPSRTALAVKAVEAGIVADDQPERPAL